jgi:putative NADH-flavin reductase
MRLAILAAAGATGLELTRQALERGHTVTAIARTPDRIAVPDSPLLTRAAADVTEPGSLAAALGDAEVLLSGLGTDTAGVLTTGARAAVAARPGRITWLGALRYRRVRQGRYRGSTAVPLER